MSYFNSELVNRQFTRQLENGVGTIVGNALEDAERTGFEINVRLSAIDKYFDPSTFILSDLKYFFKYNLESILSLESFNFIFVSYLV